MNFAKAILKKPAKSMINGISNANLGMPDYKNALLQHNNYAEILKRCGVEPIILPADEKFPDSVFTEDVAFTDGHFAVITKPGASSRAGEIKGWKSILTSHFNKIEEVSHTGTLDGGDILQIDDTFYIGLSARTNQEGFEQAKGHIEKYGKKCIAVDMPDILHLKTGISYLGNNHILAIDKFANHPLFKDFEAVRVEQDETYAANSIRVNDYVIMPAGYPKTKNRVEKAGFKVITCDVSEFCKLDGGLSCLSVRF